MRHFRQAFNRTVKRGLFYTWMNFKYAQGDNVLKFDVSRGPYIPEHESTRPASTQPKILYSRPDEKNLLLPRNQPIPSQGPTQPFSTHFHYKRPSPFQKCLPVPILRTRASSLPRRCFFPQCLKPRNITTNLPPLWGLPRKKP